MTADPEAIAPPQATGERRADAILLAVVLLMPLLLLHAKAGAEIGIAVIDAGWLLRCVRHGTWRWLRQGWVRCGLVWWSWLVVCSLPLPSLGLGGGGWDSLLQAVLALRLLLFAAALEDQILRPDQARRWLARVNALAVLWVVAETLQQFVTGTNLFGAHRGLDGELTGPFPKPLAGPTLSRILFPALVPAAWQRLQQPRLVSRVAAGGLILGGVLVMVLIGQRMPLLLTGLGLVTTALLLPRLRMLVLAGLAAAAVLVGASVVVSPPTYYRLVLKFSRQMDDFGDSAYGLIYGRAVAMAAQQPLTGRGFDGYRTGCALPRYWRSWPQNPASRIDASPDVCVQHPHNFYLQALVEGGVPGLLLFAALAVGWLGRLGAGLWRNPDPRRVGLFAAALISLWPIASTSAFTSMPTAGWFFLLLGWGLAEAGAARPG
jgi:O-antigen ligase